MNVVWKFPLEPLTDNVMEVEMPKGAQVLSVQLQGGVPTMWARCYLWKPMQKSMRFFRWLATGEEFADTTIAPTARKDLTYLATLQFGALVFHLFEEIRS